MKLFQYWDTGKPPDEVVDWMAGLRAMNPEHDYSLYDREQASWFIGKRLGERERRAFEACAVPAMQADLFRYCALFAKGGIYLDADMRPVQPLAGLIALHAPPLMLSHKGLLTTGLMVFPKPGSPFIAAMLRLSLDNIETRRFNNVLITTGPALADAIRGLLDPLWMEGTVKHPEVDKFTLGLRFGHLLDHAREVTPLTFELREAYRTLCIIHRRDAVPWIDTRKMAYQQSERDWRNWPGSIYAD
jgi:hypothetical protein